MGIPHSLFEEKLEKLKNAKGVDLDTDLTASDLQKLVEQYKNVYMEAKGEKFPSGNTASIHSFYLKKNITLLGISYDCYSSLKDF